MPGAGGGLESPCHVESHAIVANRKIQSGLGLAQLDPDGGAEARARLSSLPVPRSARDDR